MCYAYDNFIINLKKIKNNTCTHNHFLSAIIEMDWLISTTLRVRLFRGVENCEDRKYFNFIHLCLVRRVEK